MSNQATYDILVSIRDKLDGLEKAVGGMRTMGKEVENLNEKGSTLGETFKAMFSAISAEKLVEKGIEVIKEAAFSASELAMEIKHGSENMQMSARGFQVYKALVARTGGDFGSFTMAVQHMNQALVDARDVSSSAFAAFDAANLSPAALEAMDLEHRVSAVVVALSKMEDKQASLGVASALFGSRTLPHLRAAFEDLAENGYDVAAEAADKAGKVLSDRAIQGLAVKSMGAKALSMVKMQIAELEGRALPARAKLGAEPELPSADATQKLQQQKKTLQELRTELELTAKAQTIFEGNPALSDEQKRTGILAFYSQQISLLRALQSLRDPEGGFAMPLDPLHGDSLPARTKEVRELALSIEDLTNKQRAAAGIGTGALANLRSGARAVNDPTRNQEFLTARQGVEAGFLSYVQQLGSEGQQVSAVIQGSLGSALSSISGKLSGNDVRSWGDMWRSVLAGVLQNLVQLTLQMQLMRAIAGIFDLGSTAPTAGAGSAIPVSSFTGNAGSMLGNLKLGPGRALGGDVEVGRLYPVNEHGFSEVFLPRFPGRITPSGGASVLAAGGKSAGGGGITLHQVIHVSTGVQETVRAEIVGMMPALKSASVDGLRDAIARNQIQL